MWFKTMVLIGLYTYYGLPNIDHILQYLMYTPWLHYLFGFRKEQAVPPSQTVSIKSFVGIRDIDLAFWHMNNARYFVYAELSRSAYIMKTGIWKMVQKHGFSLALVGMSSRFRRELKPLQKFEVHSRAVYWTKTSLYVETQFLDAKTRFVNAVIYSNWVLFSAKTGKRIVDPERGLHIIPWNTEEANIKNVKDEYETNKRLYEFQGEPPESLSNWIDSMQQLSEKMRSGSKL
eukprot:m.98735 g.98735  ORF g.98735 m.98735 type:complete len:232 (+) comp13645_c1_seq4:229-924(+)